MIRLMHDEQCPFDETYAEIAERVAKNAERMNHEDSLWLTGPPDSMTDMGFAPRKSITNR